MVRKIAIFVLFALLSVNSIAQKVIQMENTNGVYRIACSVNGAKMKMIFDTGASSVSLSETMANFLYDNGYISKEDVLGTSKTQTADGSIHDNVVINIKDIEISGLHIKNVQAVVISSQNAPLLLGQTAIQKLGHISLNGDKLIINYYDGDYTDEEIEKLANDAEDYYNKERFNASIENWEKIKDYKDLTTYGYFILTDCCLRTNQYAKCIKYGKEWEKMYANEEPDGYSACILGNVATSLSSVGEEDKKRESLTYYEKAIQIDEKIGNSPCGTYHALALTYFELLDWDSCIKYSKKAIKGFMDRFKTSEREIETKGIDNRLIGVSLYFYARACVEKNDNSSADYLMKLSAKCNYELAIQYCNEHGIKYYSTQSLFE